MEDILNDIDEEGVRRRDILGHRSRGADRRYSKVIDIRVEPHRRWSLHHELIQGAEAVHLGEDHGERAPRHDPHRRVHLPTDSRPAIVTILADEYWARAALRIGMGKPRALASLASLSLSMDSKKDCTSSETVAATSPSTQPAS